MDSWLWDPPIYEDEDSFSLGGNWQPDFCFWHEPDPMENDAANEKACIQALRMLITKADKDITELEEDIILRQSQLAWADEAWSELCFIALREKIKFLEISIKKLKNENLQQQDQQEGDVQSQEHGDPAEKIHEILKRLLEKCFLHKDEQHKSSNVTSQSEDETRLINSVAEVCGAKASGQTTMPLCLEAQKEDDGRKNSQNKQNRDSIILGQLSEVSSIAFEEPNQSDLDKINAESNRKQGTSDHALTNKAAKMFTPENDEQAIAVLTNASGITSTCEAGWGGSNFSEGIGTGVEIPSSTKECTILNSVPKSKEPTLAEPCKLAEIIPDRMPDAVEQLAKKSIMKPPMKEEENAERLNIIDPKKQLLTLEKIGTRSPVELNKNDGWLNDRECTIAESLRELLNKRKEARKPEIKAMPISQILERMQNTEVTVPKESESNLLLRCELEQKPCSQLEPQPPQEPCLAVEMELKLPSMKNLQNWKSMIPDKHASNTGPNGNFRGQTLLDFRRNRPSNAPDACMTSDSQSEKKRKHSSISPVIKENEESGNIQTTSGKHKDTAHGMIKKDHLMSNFHAKDEAIVDKPLKSLSGSAPMDCEPDLALEFLPMDTLRKLAKANNLTGYSKLRKEELVKLLKAKSRDGDWREI